MMENEYNIKIIRLLSTVNLTKYQFEEIISIIENKASEEVLSHWVNKTTTDIRDW